MWVRFAYINSKLQPFSYHPLSFFQVNVKIASSAVLFLCKSGKMSNRMSSLKRGSSKKRKSLKEILHPNHMCRFFCKLHYFYPQKYDPQKANEKIKWKCIATESSFPESNQHLKTGYCANLIHLQTFFATFLECCT